MLKTVELKIVINQFVSNLVCIAVHYELANLHVFVNHIIYSLFVLFL